MEVGAENFIFKMNTWNVLESFSWIQIQARVLVGKELLTSSMLKQEGRESFVAGSQSD